MKIMFVVHRYVPYEGGSEYFVRDMAEELLRRGHDVTVLCGTHQGSQNGVKVTSNFNLLNQHYDLILVHGSDVTAQNTIHFNSQYINTVSPVVYMIIKPSLSEISKMGLENNKFLSYSSQLDIDFLKDQNKLFKARRIRHGIVPERTIGHFKASNTPIFVSAGGVYPNKAMTELADLYDQSGIAGELHLYGYGMFENAPSESASVKVFKGCAKDEVMAAIKSASAYILNSTEEGYGL